MRVKDLIRGGRGAIVGSPIRAARHKARAWPEAPALARRPQPAEGKALISLTLLYGAWGAASAGGRHEVQAGGLGWLCLALALVSALLVRAMIAVAVLDTPGHRSAHRRPTPKGGGVGVMAAFLLGVLWLGGGGLIWAGVASLALVSWLDDLRQFRPLVKLAAQAIAAALVLGGIGRLPGDPWLAAALGFGWLVFVTNALNFIDGLNGLAAGSMAIACLCIGLPAAAPPLLAAGLIGFLPFNYPRARIFLGDVGSQGAGLSVAAFGLLRWQDPAHGSMLAMPLLLWGILYDVGFTLCRRWHAGERLSQAHRGHLYQVAYRSGLAAPWIAALHWGFVLWGGGCALLPGVGPRPAMTLAAPLLATLPQLAWTIVVIRRARRAGIVGW